MKVQGIQITQAQIDACITKMRVWSSFTTRHLAEQAEAVGVDYDVTLRFAERLTKQERIAGNLEYWAKRWRWIGARP